MVNKLRLSGTLVYFVSLSDVEFSGGREGDWGNRQICQFGHNSQRRSTSAQLTNWERRLPALCPVGRMKGDNMSSDRVGPMSIGFTFYLGTEEFK
jgi:hypothetical protein